MTDEERLQLQRDTVARIHASERHRLSPPRLTRPRRRTPAATSLARVAARYAYLWRVSLSSAARELSVAVATAHSAWKQIYPDQSALMSRRRSS